MLVLNAASANLLGLCSPALLREHLKPLYRELEDCVDRGILPGKENILPMESAHRKLLRSQGLSLLSFCLWEDPTSCSVSPWGVQSPRVPGDAMWVWTPPHSAFQAYTLHPCAIPSVSTWVIGC